MTPPSMMPSCDWMPSIPPPLQPPPSSLVQWQRPGQTMGAPIPSTGPSFSGREQQHSGAAQQQGPLLPTVNQHCNYLPSSEISSHQLRNIDDVIAQNRKLINDDGAGTLCQILVKEAIFGKEVMERCTVSGRGGSLALPFQQMKDLKMKMFQLLPKYHTAPEQFEPVWKRCVVAIEQACGRLRREKKKRAA